MMRRSAVQLCMTVCVSSLVGSTRGVFLVRTEPQDEHRANPNATLVEAGRAFAIDETPDPRGAWKCLRVGDSRIPGAGLGVFATCALRKDTLLGEYRGDRFFMGEHGANKRLSMDWQYIWKVPRCKAPISNPVIITRRDREASHRCSSSNGFVYVDAKAVDDSKSNPLRYVNSPAPDAAVNSSLEVFFGDDRVFYYTDRDIQLDEELLVEYGDGYWKQEKQKPSNDGEKEMGGADWGNFVNDAS